jgi:MFS family permease
MTAGNALLTKMTTRLLTTELRSNFKHLYGDIFWFGVLSGSTLAFLSIYATRLGASGFQISFLTAGPAVINLLASLPVGRFLERRPLIRYSFWSALITRLGYLALIPLPWLLAPNLEIWGLVLITVLMSIPGTVLAIGFNAMFADVVPPDWRSDVVGWRNALMSASLAGTALLCGRILDMDRLAFPLNYQIVFALGAFGALMSTYHLGRLRRASDEPPLRVGRPLLDFARPGFVRMVDAVRIAVGLRFLTRARGRSLLRLDLLRTTFGPFLFSYLIFYTFQNLPVSLFPLAYVHVLNLTDGDISVGSTLFYLMMLLASLRLPYITARIGHKRLLVVGALGYSLYPILISLARGPALYWLASLLGGILWGLTSAALINRLMERMPEAERPAYMALHNLALNIGTLAGSLSGPLLAEWIGIQPALLLGAGLRILAGLLLMIWG